MPKVLSSIQSIQNWNLSPIPMEGYLQSAWTIDEGKVLSQKGTDVYSEERGLSRAIYII